MMSKKKKIYFNIRTKLMPAFVGLRTAYLSELSLRIEIFILSIVVLACIGLGFTEEALTSAEYLVLILVIALVIMAELFNTALEKMLDHLHPERHSNIARVKDTCAAAVLVVAISSIIIGSYIFIPKFYNLIFKV